MPLPDRYDPERLRRRPHVRHYFRYPLQRNDFAPIYRDEQLIGYYATKPLYRLTEAGAVDRSGAPDGRVAVLFVPVGGPGPRLLIARAGAEDLLREDGRRNWPGIRRVAEERILSALTDG